MNGLFWFLLVGLTASWFASNLRKGGGWGFVGDMAVGVIGAVTGGQLFGRACIAGGGFGLDYRGYNRRGDSHLHRTPDQKSLRRVHPSQTSFNKARQS